MPLKDMARLKGHTGQSPTQIRVQLGLRPHPRDSRTTFSLLVAHLERELWRVSNSPWRAHGVPPRLLISRAEDRQYEKLEGGRKADLPHDILIALVRMQKIVCRKGLEPD